MSAQEPAHHAEKVRACRAELRRLVMLCRGPNVAGQTELAPIEYEEIARIVLDAAAQYDGLGSPETMEP